MPQYAFDTRPKNTLEEEVRDAWGHLPRDGYPDAMCVLVTARAPIDVSDIPLVSDLCSRVEILHGAAEDGVVVRYTFKSVHQIVGGH